MKTATPALVRDQHGNIIRAEPELADVRLGETPRLRSVDLDRKALRRQRIIAGYDPCDYVDAYKVLRTRVLQKMRERGWKTLAVSSPTPNAGKTVTAINLAISLALEVNQSVLLVDANLRKPSVRDYLGFTAKYGISDHLLDGVAIDEILIHPKGLGQCVILPGNRPMLNSAEMMSSPQMGQLVDSLKKTDASRLIIYDLPELTTADALAFVPLVDGVLLVVEAGATTHDDLQQALEHLDGIPIIGTTLNKAEPA